VLQDLTGGTGVLELMHHHHVQVPAQRRTLASRTCRARSIGRRRARRRSWGSTLKATTTTTTTTTTDADEAGAAGIIFSANLY